ISITGDEVINMSGKPGVTVLVDGKPLQMESRELSQYLRALPGAAIDKIEIISNPSARYDAQGNAGIINIRLKKNKVKGTNGNLSLSYTQQQHYRSNANLGLNHRRNRLNLFLQLASSHNLQHTRGYVNRRLAGANGETILDNKTIDKDKFDTRILRTGIDFYKSKKSSFGLLFNGGYGRNPFNSPGSTAVSSNGSIDSTLQTSNNNYFKNARNALNLNYTFEDSTGHRLEANADYTGFQNSNRMSLNTLYLNRLNEPNGSTDERQFLQTNIRLYTLKADYSRPIKKWKAAMEAGWKSTWVETANNLAAAIATGTRMKPDTARSNNFLYRETIQAAYVNVKRTQHAIEWQLGLRAEYSALKGISTDLRGNK
ncbi:MAG: hypothetical protein EOP49_48325, partial [Sphingobacteriales bacterium]